MHQNGLLGVYPDWGWDAYCEAFFQVSSPYEFFGWTRWVGATPLVWGQYCCMASRIKSSRDGVKKKSIRSIGSRIIGWLGLRLLETFSNFWHRFSSSIHYSLLVINPIMAAISAVSAAPGAENWCLSGIGGRPTWHMTKGQVAVGRPWLVQSIKPPAKVRCQTIMGSGRLKDLV